MEYLKEDGSLDIERIKSLPVKEYMDAMANLTQEQVKEYVSTLPVEKTYERKPPIKVDKVKGVTPEELWKKLGISDDQSEQITEHNGEEEICEDNSPSIPEEMLHVTIRQVNRPEVTMWAVVSKRE